MPAGSCASGTPCRRGAQPCPFGHLLGREITTRPLVHVGAVRGMGRRCGMQLASCAEAGIGEALALELRNRVPIELAPLALVVGSFVPTKTKPVEVLHNEIGCSPVVCPWVQILDAKSHAATLRDGREPGDEGREGIAQVHAARGGRRKAALGRARPWAKASPALRGACAGRRSWVRVSLVRLTGVRTSPIC